VNGVASTWWELSGFHLELVMFRTFLLMTAAGAVFLVPAVAQQITESSGTTTVETVTVTAERLANARGAIQTQLGASTYTLTEQDIEAMPGGSNSQLNQVLLQAPGVTQDSFGQVHIRGEHNGLQYRLNGIALPEGISVFGQTLDPRLAQSVQLITGALPAEYGNRTGAVVDIQTNSGQLQPGGQVSIYGGSHSEIAPSVSYGGSSGHFNYFVSGDYMTNTLGIESPDGSSNPKHDRTSQYHGFAYLDDILDENSSVSAVLGTSHDMFQIPNRVGLQPSGIDEIVGLGPMDPSSGDFVLQANGQTAFPSAQLDERQREITHYAILSYLHTTDTFDYQVSVFGRYSSLFFTPGNNAGDVLYGGIAQTAYKRDEAYGLQAEGVYRVSHDHTIRFGAAYQADDLVSNTASQVLSTAPGSAVNPNPNPLCTDPANICQTSDIPVTLLDAGRKHAWNYGLYVQDEWQIVPEFTLNFGLRYDQFQAFDSENQLSPRVNAVWKPTDTTTVKLGYSRYFSPPPFELVANTDIALFDNTTSAAGHLDATPKAERADYYDLGIEQKVMEGLTLGLDSFYKTSKNEIDEGQFGAPIILTPFNYHSARQYGLEFSSSYEIGDFSSYLNASYERAAGTEIVSSQFQFSPADLAYIATHYIPNDHQQLVTVSAGASYRWDGTQFSTDLLYGSGLRRDGATPNGDHVPGYVQVNLGVRRDFSAGGLDGFTARFDVINLFDDKYEIRDGTGIGVGAPQFGPRRGFFVGLSKSL
jgi:outer membrane receptor protein involved in Fe transport